MTRVPLRARLTVVFAAVMAIVLVVAGTVVLHRLRGDLTKDVDAGLRGRAAEVRGLLLASGGDVEPSRARLAPVGTEVSQLIEPSGRVLQVTPSRVTEALLSPAARRAAIARGLIVQTSGPPGFGGTIRVLAESTHVEEFHFVILVGASLAPRAATLSHVRSQLIVGGALALLLASLAGYAVAALALRPVDRMRRQADAIRDAAPDARLSVPPGDDEIARLGRTLNALLDRLSGARARERRFVAGASHELRTPLSILTAELENALGRPRPRDELVAALHSTREEVQRLIRLADGLLEVTSAEEIRLQPEAMSVEGLVGDAVRSAGGDGLVQVAPRVAELPAIWVDPRRATSAVAELIHNALRHGSGTVTVHAVTDLDLVRISVRDEGPGPAPALDPFAPFERGPQARALPGAGLGLTIVQAIARAHGGDATHHQDRDGCTFTVSFPHAAQPGTPPAERVVAARRETRQRSHIGH